MLRLIHLIYHVCDLIGIRVLHQNNKCALKRVPFGYLDCWLIKLVAVELVFGVQREAHLVLYINGVVCLINIGGAVKVV
jgi:hypothetical protein